MNWSYIGLGSALAFIFILAILLIAALVPFYFFVLPRILAAIAIRNLFITVRPENSWFPIEKSTQFHRAVAVKKRYTLSDPIDPLATIVEGEEKVNAFLNWLRYRGFEWLSYDAPVITRPGTLRIQKVNFLKNKPPGTPLVEQLHYEEKIISSLRLQFPRYVLVKDVELSDGFKITLLVLAQVKVVTPWYTWYGLGGKAYSTIDTEIIAHVRKVAQRFSLDGLYTGNDENEMEAEVGRTLDLNATQGVIITELKVEDWDDDAPESYLEGMRSATLQQQIRRGALEFIETERQKAVKQVDVLRQQTLAAQEEVILNKVSRLALEELGGKDMETTNLLVLQKRLSSHEFLTLVRARAFEKTNVLVAGGSTLDLLGLGTVSPTTQSKNTDESGKNSDKPVKGS
jgi:hypothetical protein